MANNDDDQSSSKQSTNDDDNDEIDSDGKLFLFSLRKYLLRYSIFKR